MENKPKSESYILQEAQNVINNYIKLKEKSKKDINIWKEKYERLRILTGGIIAAVIIYSIVIIIIK